MPEDEEMKSYHELRQEEKKAYKQSQSPQSEPSGSDKPAPGSIEYELKGIGWNVRGFSQKLDEMNRTLYGIEAVLREILKELRDKP